MKDKLNFSSKIANLVVSWFNVFMFLAMRCCWSGISKTLGYEKSNSWLILNLPVFLFFIFLVVMISNIVLYWYFLIVIYCLFYIIFL